MKISFSWLRDYLKTEQTAEQLAETLTRSGLEVKNITQSGAAIPKVVVAQILSSEQHPNADRLSVCKVDEGSGTPRQIVCGAKNYKVGDKVLLALPGAVLPGEIKIKVGKLRSVESEGMMCSSKELGLGEGSEGLFILPPETKVGTELSALFPSDTILELEITPNRPDWLGHVGVAREAAVFGAGEFLWKAPSLPKTITEASVVAIQALEECSFYSIRKISDVQINASPAWLQERLEAIGLRSINNIVDVTNYVMFETAQPLHAFDAAKIQGALVVRFAREGEELEALDGKIYRLRVSDLVIADEQGPQALAGIIGGLKSGVTSSTTTILLESAVFDCATIATSKRFHEINTDAGYRFERGANATTALEASARAVELITDITVGKVDDALSMAGAFSVEKKIAFDCQQARHLLAIESDDAVISSHLHQLGLIEENGAWTIPAWRGDLEREIDLIEEVSRLHGIENIMPRCVAMPAASSEADQKYDALMKVRRQLVAATFFEARTSVLVPRESASDQALLLRNPMGAQQSTLRTTLLAGLINVVKHNLHQGATSVRLFEIGKIFQKEKVVLGAVQAEEQQELALIMTGEAHEPSWRGEASRALDLYDLKGVVDQLAWGKIHYRPWKETLLPGLGLMLEVLYEDQPCGYLGLMTPAAARELMLTGQEYPIVVAALEIEKIFQKKSWRRDYEFGKFPSMKRDLAFLVDKTVSYASLEQLLLSANESLLQLVSPFDVFMDPTGKKIAAEKKSIALSLTFQHPERTLTTEEVHKACERLISVLKEKLHAEMRS